MGTIRSIIIFALPWHSVVTLIQLHLRMPLLKNTEHAISARVMTQIYDEPIRRVVKEMPDYVLKSQPTVVQLTVRRAYLCLR